MRSNPRTTWIGAAFLVGSLVLAPPPSSAHRVDEALERLVVEWAQTPSQHAALARYFRYKSDEARDDARLHRRMLVWYSGVSSGLRQRMKRHCRELAANYTSVAQDYEALAVFHEAQAQADE